MRRQVSFALSAGQIRQFDTSHELEIGSPKTIFLENGPDGKRNDWDHWWEQKKDIETEFDGIVGLKISWDGALIIPKEEFEPY